MLTPSLSLFPTPTLFPSPSHLLASLLLCFVFPPWPLVLSWHSAQHPGRGVCYRNMGSLAVITAPKKTSLHPQCLLTVHRYSGFLSGLGYESQTIAGMPSPGWMELQEKNDSLPLGRQKTSNPRKNTGEESTESQLSRMVFPMEMDVYLPTHTFNWGHIVGPTSVSEPLEKWVEFRFLHSIPS